MEVFFTVDIPLKDLKKRTCSLLPLTAKLGVPLLYHHTSPDDQLNRTCTTLNIECDVSSPMFGKSPKGIRGDVIIARGDGRDLRLEQFVGINEVLLNLIIPIQGFAAASRFCASPEASVPPELEALKEDAKTAAGRLTRERFVGMFKEVLMVTKREEDAQRWQGVECPVHDGCVVCEKTTMEDGAALLICGKCQTTKYCSKECQVEDWKLHKVVCRKK